MKKIAFAALASFGLASAAGSLWGPSTDNFPSLQVKVPSADACWQQHPTPSEDNPCYNSTAGWWFGYSSNGGTVKVRKNGSYMDFGEGVSITESSDGSSLIDEDGMYIKFTAPTAAASNKPSIGGIGFQYNKPEGEQNITSWGGYCITYDLSGSSLQFELGWDEAGDRYDTWYATLTAGSNKTVDLDWAKAPQTSKTAGDFKKDDWDTGINNQPISTATGQAWSVKIRLKNGSTTAATNADFVLRQLGKKGECSAADINPIIGGATVSSMNFNVTGRTLSLVSSKAQSVQIINLYGAVVQAQTLSPGAKMDLSKLPAGVYMVRAPAAGYVSRIVLK